MNELHDLATPVSPPPGGASDDSVLSRPIVLTGRGGSGTRLLSDLALSCEVFLGNELNPTNDSVEWVETLYALAVRKLSDDAPAAEHADRRHRISGTLRNNAIEILGERSVDRTCRWGWKLPESMLLVPELMDAFPCARLVHLVRHPVSSSLRRSHKTSRTSNAVGLIVLRRAYAQAGRDPDRIDEDEDYLRNALTWRYQVGEVVRHAREHLPTERHLEIRFEDLCDDPRRVRERFSRFVDGGGPPHGLGHEPIPAIDRDRVPPIDPRDPRARRVWRLCGELAATFGYDETGVAP